MKQSQLTFAILLTNVLVTPRNYFLLCRLYAKKNENPLPPHDCPYRLANDFGEFFCKKIETLKCDINNISPFMEKPTVERRSPERKLESFCQLTEEDVCKIITASSNASCPLDPIPTCLLKQCTDVLTPVITKLINSSLQVI